MTKLECIALFVLCALDKNCQYLSPCYDAVTQVTIKPVSKKCVLPVSKLVVFFTSRYLCCSLRFDVLGTLAPYP